MYVPLHSSMLWLAVLFLMKKHNMHAQLHIHIVVLSSIRYCLHTCNIEVEPCATVAACFG